MYGELRRAYEATHAMEVASRPETDATEAVRLFYKLGLSENEVMVHPGNGEVVATVEGVRKVREMAEPLIDDPERADAFRAAIEKMTSAAEVGDTIH